MNNENDNQKVSFNLAHFKRTLAKNKRNVVYTAFILFNHFSFGVNMNIMAAALVDLRFVYQVSIDDISYIPVALGVGYLLGALAGFFYKWLNRQLMLSLFVILMAVTVALSPQYGILWVAIPALLLNGIGCGAWDSGSGFWMVEMWPVGNAIMLQLIQFTYGCGSIAAPLLMAPFVHGEATNRTDSHGNVQNITREDRIHSLTIPFTIVGVSLTIAPIIMLILFFVARYEKSEVNLSSNEKNKKNINSAIQPKTISNRSIKLIMCGICLSSYATSELGWFGFSTAMYQHIDNPLDAVTANRVQSVLAACFTVGRLITALIIIFTKIVPDYIITYHYVIAAIGYFTLLFGRNSQSWLYAGSAIMGYGYSAMWPAILAFAEHHLRLSDRICSFYSFLTGLLSMTIPVILGMTFDQHPMILFLLVGIYMSISCSMFVGVRFWIYLNSNKVA